MKMLSMGFLCWFAQLAVAADHGAALKNYLADDVVAVAYFDLSSIDTLGVLEWGGKLGLVPAEQRGEMVLVAMATQRQLDKLADAGVSHGYLLFRMSDVSHGGPSWVVPIAEGVATDAALSMIDTWADVIRSPVLPEFWEAANGFVLGGMTEQQLEQLKNTRPSAPRDLSDAWAALGQGNAGLVICGDSDSRRVVREMFPPLPEPFAALDGRLLADGLQWGGVALKLPPQADAEIIFETRDDATAEVVGQLISRGIDFLEKLPLASTLLTATDREKLVEAISPQVEGVRVQIRLDEALGDAERLAKLLGPPVRSAWQAAWRNTRMNQFKNIGLAFHNYYDRHKSLPAQANYDENGKPLLSWRVHLLPYLDQSALYKQFHLDEPWDSEHNRPLAEILPAIYADPDSALHRINAAGKTTYVVPVGSGTLFDGSEGTVFKEVIDGTSNTILLVEVVPERAVLWTQPEDWEVDLRDPWEGVRHEDRKGFVAATCDSAAHYWDRSVDNVKLRALLTKAGGEVIVWP